MMNRNPGRWPGASPVHILLLKFDVTELCDFHISHKSPVEIKHADSRLDRERGERDRERNQIENIISLFQV